MIKTRLTLWDFMRDHSTLVEDLALAAKELGGKNRAISRNLDRYAKELKDYDRFLCEEYHSPFNEEQMWVLEYNEKNHQFHYNNSHNGSGFRQALFSFGWMPVCVLPDCYSTDKEFGNLLNKIADGGLSYQETVSRVYSWFIQKNQI